MKAPHGLIRLPAPLAALAGAGLLASTSVLAAQATAPPAHAGPAGAGPPAATADATGYAVLSHFAAGDEGGWDYLTVDAPGRRLFVSRSSHVQVLDLATGAPSATSPAPTGSTGSPSTRSFTAASPATAGPRP